MKNKITDYQLVVEFDENELEEKVQELIDIKDECWEPFGSLVVTTHPPYSKTYYVSTNGENVFKIKIIKVD